MAAFKLSFGKGAVTSMGKGPRLLLLRGRVKTLVFPSIAGFAMSEINARDPTPRDNAIDLAAIQSQRIAPDDNVWTARLVLFLRCMAVLSVAKGLFHWAQVTGFVGGQDDAFEVQPLAWQTATVYFAVIELVAAVGLWLATPWGAVVWLTTVVSMAIIELMFPAIYGGNLVIVALEGTMLTAYLVLAWLAARERPP